MYAFINILVPIFICVVLPVLIVWLVGRVAINNDNKKTEVLIEAIKANKDIDTETLTQAFAKKKSKTKTPYDILIKRLLIGCTLSLSGIAIFLSYGIGLLTGAFEPGDESIGWVFVSSILLAVGIGFLIVYFVSRKNTPKPEKNA